MPIQNLVHPGSIPASRILILLIGRSGWLNPYLAAKLGIPIYSILLTIMGIWEFGRLSGIYPQSLRLRRRSHDPI